MRQPGCAEAFRYEVADPYSSATFDARETPIHKLMLDSTSFSLRGALQRGRAFADFSRHRDGVHCGTRLWPCGLAAAATVDSRLRSRGAYSQPLHSRLACS